MHENWIKWAEGVHNTAYEKLSEIKEIVSTKSSEELADIGWVLKKMNEQIDSLRKEIDKTKNLVEKIACLKATQDQQDKLYGELAVATPDVEVYATLPHPQRNPEEWIKLMDYLGIPDQVVQKDLIHHLHWPAFTEFLAEQMKEGKPTPPGISQDKMGARHYLKYRGRKKNA